MAAFDCRCPDSSRVIVAYYGVYCSRCGALSVAYRDSDTMTRVPEVKHIGGER